MTTQTSSPEIHQQTGPANPTDKEPSIREAVYNFVFCDHTSDMIKPIAKALEGSDILALEAVGLASEEVRELVNKLFTEYVSSSTHEVRKREIAKILSPDEGTDGNSFYLELLDHFSASDKKVVTIDVNTGTPSYDFIQASREAAINVENSEVEREPRQTTLDKLSHQLKVEAESLKSRESVVIEQLRKLGADNPGSTIGVMMGAVHTGVRHALSNESKTSARYVVRSWQGEGTKARFNYEDEALRTLRFKKSELEKPLLQRVLLETISSMYDQYPLRRINMDNWNDDRIEQELERRKDSV